MTAVNPATKRGVFPKLWDILSLPERRQLLWLMPAVVIMALFETAGVASIVPFLALLSDPTALERHTILVWAYTHLGFTSRESFFFGVGVAVLCLLTVGNLISALTTWALLRFSWMGNHTLSVRLLYAYLHRPYDFFLARNTTDLAKNILSEVNSVVTGVLLQWVQLMARVVVILFVVSALLFVDPFMAIGVSILFGGVYGSLFWLVRYRVARNGNIRLMANQARYKLATEALGGIKELKLYGLEAAVLGQYEQPSTLSATTQADNAALLQMPRYALETIAFGGVLVIVLYLLSIGHSLTDALPVLGLYAFAAYRLLPGLQQIFSGITSIRFNLGVLDELHADLTQAGTSEAPAGEEAVAFGRELRLENVCFGYDGSGRTALNSVNLSIRPGEWVALVGATGSGKSTLVDIMLGLLEPRPGQVLLDGAPLDGPRRRSWQKLVAYVPQQIFLVDDTVENNICFGIPPHELDRRRLEWSAKIAQIHDFVANELRHGYATLIGERGIRLSGGQRQRIGIARALYRRPSLLVLDEATSALDNETETNFFEALHRELRDCSVVSIAHRLTTTRDFDRIIVLEAGCVIDEGTFAELSARNRQFQIVSG